MILYVKEKIVRCFFIGLNWNYKGLKVVNFLKN